MFKLRLLFACCFVLVGVFVQPAQAQEEVSPEERPVVNFVVADEFKTLVEQATEQIRSTAQVNDNGDAWQLFRRMRPVIRDVLGTEGHFSPSIQRVVDESLPEDAPAPLNIKIEPGPQSTVTSVDIQFDGEINKDEFAARRERLKTLWLLGTNQAFNQTDWSASKDNLLRDLLAKDFAAATLSESQANVDPDANTVTLRVVYDSGPVFTFGELKIKGLNKYRNDLVARYNTIQPGDRYEQERLLTLLADLQGTSYFSAVDVSLSVVEDLIMRFDYQPRQASSD